MRSTVKPDHQTCCSPTQSPLPCQSQAARLAIVGSAALLACNRALTREICGIFFRDINGLAIKAHEGRSRFQVRGWLGVGLGAEVGGRVGCHYLMLLHCSAGLCG